MTPVAGQQIVPSPGAGIASRAAPHPLLLSIDLEEWYHGRWATGYKQSLWWDTATFFRTVYGSDRPRGDVMAPTRWLLETLRQEQVRATVFVLAEMADWYADLIREIAAEGHEIACHALHHRDMSLYTQAEYAAELRTAKTRLEKLTGTPVVGFRAPSLVVEPWLADVLEANGFRYDSSVCPSWGFRGKYAGMRNCSQYPYRVGQKVQEIGERNLWELPVQTMPLLRIPAACGIATRVFGYWWARLALTHWNRRGPCHYYLHPYEVGNDVYPDGLSLYVRILSRNRGPYLRTAFRRILAAYRGRTLGCLAYLNSGSPALPGHSAITR
jgi:peptidoglycan/xylan/chitin deacetylase (PgdA/CDA1 family)